MRFFKFIFSLMVCTITALSPQAAAAPGLDSPQPVGAYLNGVFPQRTPGPSGTWALTNAFPNLTFIDPVRMIKDPRGSSHVYVVCRNGDVWRIPFSASARNSDKVHVLNLRSTTWGYWDAGMMSIAFHPDFGVPGNPNRGYFYVFYQYTPNRASTSTSSPSYMRLSRFTIPDGQQIADPASEYVMIQQYDRDNWHNGGQMYFGPDRFLHFPIGDEGAANDSLNGTQKINDRLFSGIFRIDVDQDPTRSHPIRRQPQQISMPAGWPSSFTRGYGIPNDNPWLDPSGSVLEEFWSIGTRSPHSMHFDSQTGETWIADVGQGTREEITIARKGGNHQWPYKEGFANGPKAKPANLIGVEVPPVFDYPRSMGGCIIGGVVYRGSLHAGSLTGKYIFGDHNTRALYSLERPEGGGASAQYLTSVSRAGGTKRGLSGICEGPDKELYFMELGDTGADTGVIYRLIRSGTPVADPPQLLSQTGAFSDLQTLTPVSGLIPFEVNSPLWTDGAVKDRWVAIPNDGSHNTAAERVGYKDSGSWTFPVGTVLVKHFALPVDARQPSLVKPVETRFFVHGSDGVYYGVTYRWNEAGTDAALLTGGDSRDFTITDVHGNTRTQRWDFPSRADCRTCHTAGADNVLGLRAHQMAKDMTYALTGRTSNQLETWNHLGIFGSSFGSRDPATVAAAVNPNDPHASLDMRVRSYLAANCSHCHYEGGVSANFDASFHVPLSSQGIVDGLINRPLSGVANRVVSPADLVNSIMHSRMSVVGANQMPPLGKNVVDEDAVALLTDWIRSLDSASFGAVPSNVSPVANQDDFTATHAASSQLNVLANDSDANKSLGIHGVSIVTPPSHGTISISGAQKRLIYTHDGSSARSDSFSYRVTDPQGASSAVTTVHLSVPFDFAAWVSVNPDAGGSPSSNNDGDLYPDLLEFALGGVPGSGHSPAPDSIVIGENGGEVTLVIKRPGDLSGITYRVETSSDLATWHPGASGTPRGTDELVFENLQNAQGVSADAGFARLRVALDDSIESQVTLPLGWLATTYGPATRTAGFPFRKLPVFSSAVTSTNGMELSVHGDASLPTGFSGFAEVISGANAGHRFEVEGSESGKIRLKSSSANTLATVPDLTGAQIVVSAHQTLGAMFPKEKFYGRTNPAEADQLQFYANDGAGSGAFQLYYLLDARPNNPAHEWRAFLPGGGNQGGRAILPGEGVIVKRSLDAEPVRVVYSGQVRANPFVQKLPAGVTLAASGFPVPLDPRSRGMLDPAANFIASTNLNAADQFQLYENGRFRLFYLLNHPAEGHQWRESVPSSPVFNDVPIFSPTEAVFFKRNQMSPVYRIPTVWSP